MMPFDKLNSLKKTSSGAGKVKHFSEVFENTEVEKALAAGIFHRDDVPIKAVKKHVKERGIETR